MPYDTLMALIPLWDLLQHLLQFLQLQTGVFDFSVRANDDDGREGLDHEGVK